MVSAVPCTAIVLELESTLGAPLILGPSLTLQVEKLRPGERNENQLFAKTLLCTKQSSRVLYSIELLSLNLCRVKLIQDKIALFYS